MPAESNEKGVVVMKLFFKSSFLGIFILTLLIVGSCSVDRLSPTLLIVCLAKDATDCVETTNNDPIEAYIKTEGSDCDGTNTNVVAYGEDVVDCLSVKGECSSALGTWSTNEGGNLISGITEGNYVVDIFIDSNSNDELDEGEPSACLPITVLVGDTIFDIDDWTDFVPL